MELRQYLSLLKHWAWLLILGVVAGIGVGYAISIYSTPIYQATTKVLVMRAPQERNSDLAYLSDQQLTQTFIQLLSTNPVLDGASLQLNYQVKREQIKVQQVRDTQVIEVTVEDTDPFRAAMTANVLVAVLVDQNEILQSSRYTTSEQSVQFQIQQVEAQIDSLELEIDALASQSAQDQIIQAETRILELQTEIAQVDTEIAALTESESLANTNLLSEKRSRLAQLQSILDLYQEVYSNLVVLGRPAETGDIDRLSRMEKTLELYQQIYLQLLTNLEAIRLARLQNTPNVVQIEAATIPFRPVRPDPVMNSALAGAVGLMIAAGIAFVIEYTNDTLRTPRDVDNALGLPIIGYISDIPARRQAIPGLSVAHQPRAPVSEAFRSLRTNLEFSEGEQPLQTILVTSSRPGEGKTTVAANLAASYAQGGKRVILVDADLRRPAVHRVLGVSNRMGLSTLLRGAVTLESVWHKWGGTDRLLVITSGGLPPNPTELLGSDRMLFVLAELRKQADIVIIDSPPSLVADSQVLGSMVDGVVLVIQPGASHTDEAKATLTQFTRAGARLIGVVFNRIPRNRSHYYGGYRYYTPNSYHSYSDNGGKKKESRKPQTRSPQKTKPVSVRPKGQVTPKK